MFPRKRLEDEDLFPISLECEEMGCLVVVDFDRENQIFTLFVDEVPYLELPELPVAVGPLGPQLIYPGS